MKNKIEKKNNVKSVDIKKTSCRIKECCEFFCQVKNQGGKRRGWIDYCRVNIKFKIGGRGE